jgi:L-asparaginase II
MDAPILAKVIRGETVESVHRGHIVAIDGSGQVLFELGDPEMVTFFRSACKPFQAMPLVTNGAADAFGFSDDEIALACASHSGEPFHVEIAARMLQKIGLTESDLQCGTHLPFSEKESERLLRANDEITQLHNNCSGKHAGMLATAKHLGSEIKTYLSPEHPVQQQILSTIATLCEIPKEKIEIGIDGCCAPNFAVPLNRMARSFLNLIAPPGDFADEVVRSASARIVSSMVKYPELIGGSERLDTILMQAAPGKMISKVGADGVWLCGILPGGKFPKGAAIALKVEDGDDKRARPVAAIDILKRIGILSPDDLPELSPMALKNRNGDTVGKVESALWI